MHWPTHKRHVPAREVLSASSCKLQSCKLCVVRMMMRNKMQGSIPTYNTYFISYHINIWCVHAVLSSRHVHNSGGFREIAMPTGSTLRSPASLHHRLSVTTRKRCGTAARHSTRLPQDFHNFPTLPREIARVAGCSCSPLLWPLRLSFRLHAGRALWQAGAHMAPRPLRQAAHSGRLLLVGRAPWQPPSKRHAWAPSRQGPASSPITHQSSPL